MEKPVDIFLANKDIDFPFCLCWANENWTRTWDGLNQNILIEQKYHKNDPEKFIHDLKKYLDDPRYIKVDGKPVIMIYAPDAIPNFGKVVEKWRKTARKIGIGEILIWSKNNILDHKFKNTDFVDAEFDFAPTGCSFLDSILEQNKNHSIMDYSIMVQNYHKRELYYNHFPVKPFYYSCTLGWDNSPRRKTGYCVLSNYSPKEFYNWLRLIIEETKRRFPPDQRFVFINAWNEWAEGTYLEPDQKYGYTNINTAAKAIYHLPYQPDDFTVLDQSSPTEKRPGKVAIQVHAFYPDILPQLIAYLKNIPFPYDLYISTNTADKKEDIENILKSHKLTPTKLEVTQNVGRDVYPFLHQMQKVYQKYDYIGHFHTKKTPQGFYGDAWRTYLYSNLLGPKQNIERIFGQFRDSQIGIIMPPCFYAIHSGMELGSNAETTNVILQKIGLTPVDEGTNIIFPAGTMFWAKTKSIEDIFKLNLKASDFPEEHSQVDGTIAHALERLFGIIPKQRGYKILQVTNPDAEE